MIRDGNPLRFFNLPDLLLPQPWLLDDDDRVFGHVLTVDDAVFQAHDNLWVGSLDEAMNRNWIDPGQLDEWAGIYVDVLRTHADRAEELARSVRSREALMKVADDAADRSGQKDSGKGGKSGGRM